MFFVIGIPIFGFALQNALSIDEVYLQSQSDAFYLKGEIALNKNQKRQALSFFKQALFYSPQSSFLRFKMAEVYLKENLFAEATKEYQQILQKDPYFNEAREQLALIYVSNDLNKEALGEYRALAHRNPENSLIQMKKAIFTLNIGQKRQALKELKKLESHQIPHSKKIELYLIQAYIYGELGFLDKKKKQILKAERGIKSMDSLSKIVDFHRKQNNSAEAISLLERHQNKDEFVLPITKQLFLLYKAQGRLQKSAQQLEKLKNLGSLEPNQYFDMALSFIQQKKNKEAIFLLRDFSNHFPSSDVSHYLLGTLYEKENQLPKSLEAYQHISEKSLYFPVALLQTAYIYHRTNRLNDSLSLLKPYVFKFQKDPEPLLLYSQLLWEKREFNKSLSVLDKGLNLFPENPNVLFLKGVYTYKKKPHPSSLDDVKTLLKYRPLHPEALNFLAYAYAEQNVHLSEAEKLAKKALALKPHSGFFLDTMGWVLYKKGLYKKALPYFQKAFSKNKQEKSIVEHLAKTYHELGDLKNSEFFFKKFLELKKYEQNSDKVSSLFIQTNF